MSTFICHVTNKNSTYVCETFDYSINMHKYYAKSAFPIFL